LISSNFVYVFEDSICVDNKCTNKRRMMMRIKRDTSNSDSEIFDKSQVVDIITRYNDRWLEFEKQTEDNYTNLDFVLYVVNWPIMIFKILLKMKPLFDLRTSVNFTPRENQVVVNLISMLNVEILRYQARFNKYMNETNLQLVMQEYLSDDLQFIEDIKQQVFKDKTLLENRLFTLKKERQRELLGYRGK
jgi:hypothetical protein